MPDIVIPSFRSAQKADASPVPVICWVLISAIHYHDARLELFARQGRFRPHMIQLTSSDLFAETSPRNDPKSFRRETLFQNASWGLVPPAYTCIPVACRARCSKSVRGLHKRGGRKADVSPASFGACGGVCPQCCCRTATSMMIAVSGGRRRSSAGSCDVSRSDRWPTPTPGTSAGWEWWTRSSMGMT